MADNTESRLTVQGVGDQYEDQAESLPEGEFDLPNVETILTGPEIWPEWTESAKSILQMNSLGALICMNASRPNEREKIYKRWKQCSIIVAAWLLVNVSEPLQNRMMKINISANFADEVWDELQAMNTGCIYHHVDLWEEFVSIRASQYDDVEEFTKAYSSSYRRARNQGLPLEPYVALTGYLAQIEVSHPEVAGKIMDQLYMDERKPRDFDSKTVFSIFCDIQDHITTERWCLKRARKYGPNT